MLHNEIGIKGCGRLNLYVKWWDGPLWYCMECPRKGWSVGWVIYQYIYLNPSSLVSWCLNTIQERVTFTIEYHILGSSEVTCETKEYLLNNWISEWFETLTPTFSVTFVFIIVTPILLLFKRGWNSLWLFKGKTFLKCEGCRDMLYTIQDHLQLISSTNWQLSRNKVSCHCSFPRVCSDLDGHLGQSGSQFTHTLVNLRLTF